MGTPSPGNFLLLRFPASLQSKQIILTAGLFVLFIWALALIAATVLRGRIEEVLANQQFATARHVATEIEGKLTNRINSLARAAESLSPNLGSKELTARQAALEHLFPLGLALAGRDGQLIAAPAPSDSQGKVQINPVLVSRVLAGGRPAIGKPMIDKNPDRLVLAIGVPVPGPADKPQAVLIGVMEIAAPNFLGIIADPSLPGGSEFTVISLPDRMILASSEAPGLAAPTPVSGDISMLERFAAGFEGSGLGMDPAGVRRLYSGKRVPAADWIVMASLPEAAVFHPITVMQQYFYATAAVLSLLAILLIAWITRQTLAPLAEARAAMALITDGKADLAPLPVKRNDEVGQLLGTFNRLVEDRKYREAALAESEQRFRQLVESAPDAIFVQIDGRFVYTNSAAAALFGASTLEELLGQPVVDRFHPESRQIVLETIRSARSSSKATAPLEARALRLDGPEVHVEATLVALRHGQEDGELIFLRNISERKQADEAIRNSQADLALSRQKLRELSAHNEFRLEEERRSIAREIHDELGQLLTALKMDSSLLRRTYPEDSYLQGKIKGMVSLLDNTIDVARHVVTNLRPPALDHGIIPAFEWLAEDFSLRWEIPCRLEMDAEDIILDDTRATALFRIVQESLTNVARHADAKEVVVSLRRTGSELQLCIADDGRGFDPGVVAGKPGFGLQGMRERAIAFDGRMQVASSPGGGTTVTVEIPL